MLYPIIIEKEENTDYWVIVPDFPGVFSGGKTLEEAMANVQDAVETFYDGEEKCEIPDPSPLHAVLASEDARHGAVVLVDVDFAFLDKKSVPVNITLPAYLRDRIDRAAKQAKMSRSRFIALATQEAIRNRSQPTF